MKHFVTINPSVTDLLGSNSPYCCVLLGFPFEISDNDVKSFLEPVAESIVSCFLVRTHEGHCHCITGFDSEKSLTSFIKLYNNSHFPTYRDVAPCLICPIACVLSTVSTCAGETTPALSCHLSDSSSRPLGPEGSQDSTDKLESYNGIFSFRKIDSVTLDLFVVAEGQVSGLWQGSPDVASGGRPWIVSCTVGRLLREEGEVQSSAKHSYHLEGNVLTIVRDDSESSSSSQLSGDGAMRVVQLPTCTICLRRIVHSTTQIPGVSDIPIGSSFIGNQNRCSVCEIYGNTSSPHRQCSQCVGTLRENLWSCMVCAHTGCGRYTLQHAKIHYDRCLQHAFAFELATGRVWDYCQDVFVHHQSLCGPSGGAGALSAASHGPFDASKHATSASSFSSVAAAGPSKSNCSLSRDHDDILTKIVDTSSGVYHPQEAVESGGHGSVDKNGIISQHYSKYNDSYAQLDEITQSKIQVLLSEYESKLEQQLGELSLYYEKCLAKETVLALERSVSLRPTEEPSSSSSTTSGSVSTLEPAVRVELAVSVAAEDILDRITREKCEISALEERYSTCLGSIGEGEEHIRWARKENEKLMRQQRSQQSQLAESCSRVGELKRQHKLQVEDLRSQIADVDFYLRTSKLVEGSSMKDEIREGHVITTEAPTPAPKPKKKGNKKNC